MHPRDHLASDPPAAAVGRVRRLLDGRVTGEASFVYRSPDRWRVRHASGREIVSVGPDIWERPDSRAGWTHHRARGGASAHHTGYLRTMLFPQRQTPLTDKSSRVVDEQRAADGSRRLRVDHDEPVSGSMVLDIAPDGRLQRIEGADGDRIELSADYASPPDPGLFDPSTPWSPDDPR